MLVGHQADGRRPLMVRGPQVENRCARASFQSFCTIPEPSQS